MPHAQARAVFCFFFIVVAFAGFWAARWRRADLHSLEEWGLAGRNFGTLISWFLIGGDLYTAYTIIAIPALMYGAGAPGFFAVPYCIMSYPYMMLVLPRLWRVCHRHGYVTLSDFVRGRYNSRWLAIALALTGILATMPYIALQLVGMRAVIAAMGVTGEWPLIAAFVILAAYTYTSGLRAPAVIAIVKDVMLYIMVLTAILVLPHRFGGYSHIFAAAQTALATHKPPGGILLAPRQYSGYATLALGSALALALYPHTATGVLSAASGKVIRRNTALLPAYNVILGMIALLGFVALAAGVQTKDTSQVVPLLFMQQFPEWFAGFSLAAIGIGALVPAAIMSIAAANLFTRNLYGEFCRTPMTHRAESTMAKVVSLLLKFGALAFVLYQPAQYAVELQLLGGIWILQLFPAVICGLFTRWLYGRALLVGWLAGIASGTAMAYSLQLKSSVYTIAIDGHTFSAYAALPALVINLLVSILISAAMHLKNVKPDQDATQNADYTEAVPASV
jgi:SSS family solute:Na+ symporter